MDDCQAERPALTAARLLQNAQRLAQAQGLDPAGKASFDDLVARIKTSPDVFDRDAVNDYLRGHPHNTEKLTYTEIAPGWITFTADTSHSLSIPIHPDNLAVFMDDPEPGYERHGAKPSDTTDPAQSAMETIRAMLDGASKRAAAEAKGAKVTGAISAMHNARRSDGRPHRYAAEK